jgi:hypothetical protein
MRTTAIYSAVAGPNTVAYTVDRDCVLRALSATVTDVVLSTEPDLTIALAALGYFTGVKTDLLRLIASGAANTIQRWENINFPLSKGTTLYVAFNAAGTCYLQLEDVQPAE